MQKNPSISAKEFMCNHGPGAEPVRLSVHPQQDEDSVAPDPGRVLQMNVLGCREPGCNVLQAV